MGKIVVLVHPLLDEQFISLLVRQREAHGWPWSHESNGARYEVVVGFRFFITSDDYAMYMKCIKTQGEKW